MSEPLPFGALAAVLSASARWTTVPESTYTPPATDEDPDPDPIVTPERQVIAVDPADLPAEIVDEHGRVSLTQQVAMLWGAVRQVPDQEIRTVVGRVTLDSGTYLAGATQDLPVAWDSAPLKVPTGAVVTVHAGVAWMGKVTAAVVPDSLTAQGCVVRVRFLAAVVPRPNQPVTLEPQGLYLWTPPNEGTTT